jgi:hypothetical protein
MLAKKAFSRRKISCLIAAVYAPASLWQLVFLLMGWVAAALFPLMDDDSSFVPFVTFSPFEHKRK